MAKAKTTSKRKIPNTKQPSPPSSPETQESAKNPQELVYDIFCQKCHEDENNVTTHQRVCIAMEEEYDFPRAETRLVIKELLNLEIIVNSKGRTEKAKKNMNGKLKVQKENYYASNMDALEGRIANMSVHLAENEDLEGEEEEEASEEPAPVVQKKSQVKRVNSGKNKKPTKKQATPQSSAESEEIEDPIPASPPKKSTIKKKKTTGEEPKRKHVESEDESGEVHSEEDNEEEEESGEIIEDRGRSKKRVVRPPTPIKKPAAKRTKMDGQKSARRKSVGLVQKAKARTSSRKRETKPDKKTLDPETKAKTRAAPRKVATRKTSRRIAGK